MANEKDNRYYLHVNGNIVASKPETPQGFEDIERIQKEKFDGQGEVV